MLLVPILQFFVSGSRNGCRCTDLGLSTMLDENVPNSQCRTAQSIRRIMREYEEIKSNKNAYWTATPIDEEEPYEWHFTVRGPVGTEFEVQIELARIISCTFVLQFCFFRAPSF